MDNFDKIQHQSWETMAREDLVAGIQRRFISGDNTTVAWINLDAGAVVPRHSHANEQVTVILSGCIRFIYGENGERTVTVHQGEFIVSPPHIPHRVETLETALAIDIFAPTRQDWIDGTDSYFQNRDDAEMR